MSIQPWDPIAATISFNLEIDLKRLKTVLEPSSKVLDFGCGYGRLSKLLTNQGIKNVCGVDPSSKMIEL